MEMSMEELQLRMARAKLETALAQVENARLRAQIEVENARLRAQREERRKIFLEDLTRWEKKKEQFLGLIEDLMSLKTFCLTKIQNIEDLAGCSEEARNSLDKFSSGLAEIEDKEVHARQCLAEVEIKIADLLEILNRLDG